MRKWAGKKAYIYSRVSTKDQKDNGYSLQQQKELLFSFCKNNDIEIIEYFEEDYTGTTMDRPKYNLIKKSIKSEKIDLLLFHKWDRFARKTKKALGEIEDFERKNIEVNAISEQIDFEIPQQEIMLLLYLGIAEVENKVRSKRTKDGIIGALREGRHVNRAPIGYLNGKDPLYPKKPLIYPCPLKSILISDIFEKYATGHYSQESLRKEYIKKGINRSKSQFSNLLSNKLYISEIIISKNNGPIEIIQGLHEAIVDEATFYKVQKVKLGKSNIRLNVKKTSKHEEVFPLRGGVLKCAKCGNNLTGSFSTSRNGSKIPYYHCNNGCKERFSIEIAHKELLETFKTFKPPKEVIGLFKTILIDNYKINQHEQIKNNKRLNLSRQKLDEKLDNLTEKFISDEIDKESYKRLKNKFTEQINEIIINLNELSDYHKGLDKYIDFGLQFLVCLDIFYEKATTELKRRIIGSIFYEKLVFEKKKYRTIKLNDAVSLLFNNSKGLQTIEHKKRHSISKVSYSVAGTGLEPVTFGL